MPRKPQRSPSPAPSSSSQSDIEDEDANKSTFFPSIEPVTPAQWTSKVHLLAHRTSTRSPASQLPPEILIHVFKQLHSTRDIHSCLFVSRNWCECSVELLWHKPGISKLPTFIRMMRVLARADQTFTYARFIRRLNFLFLGKDLNNAVFSRLSQCVRLERLTLVNCSTITDEALTNVLISCPNLVAIDLTGVTETTDKAISALASTCKRLQGINLGGCKNVTDAGILALAANCPLLRRVKLSSIEAITDSAVSALARSCPLMLEIDLNGCKQITDLSVRDLWTYSLHMREMRLAQCVLLTDAAFPALEKDNVPSTGVNPFPTTAPKEELSPLILSRPFDHLRMLDLTSCSKITDDAIEGIMASSPKIRNLVLAKCSLITDVAVEAICRLGKHLHYLHLGHTSSITDVSVRQLARTCVRLKYIDLANCTLLTDMSVFELSALQKLRRIGLVRVNNLTDQAVYALAERHATLERIHLSYCDQISVIAVHFLLQKLPKLTHLSLTGIGAFRKPELQQFCRQPPADFNSSQRAAFCVFSNKGVADLRVYLQKMFHALTEAEGDNDTDDDDDTYDEDKQMNINIDMADDVDEEMTFLPSREYRAPVVAPLPRRLRPDSPGSNFNGSEDIVMDMEPTSVPSSSTATQMSFHRDHLTQAQLPNGVREGSSRRSRGFGQQPLIEPPTSPAPSETMSNRSMNSNGAGFFRTYRETASVAGSSRYNVLTPDLDYAEIGHGRGARGAGTSDNGSSSAGGASTTTLRGYDMQYEAFSAPRRAAESSQAQQHVVLNPSNPYQSHHPMERETATPRASRRSHRQRAWEENGHGERSPSRSPTTRELQESVQSALGGGPGVGGSHHVRDDGRGRAVGRRGWRNTLTAAEQYASSFLFGGRGGQGQDG